MAACVRSRLNSLSSELSFGRLAAIFSERRAGDLLANRRKPQSALMKDLGRKGLLFPEQPEQQVLGPNVFVIKTLGFFGAVGQNPLAFVAERQVDRGRDLLANGGVGLDLLPDGVNRRVRAKETVGQRLVFAQQARGAGAPFRCRGCQTGWLRISRRR